MNRITVEIGHPQAFKIGDVPHLRDKVDIKLSGETAAALAQRPIQYGTGFTLLSGKYVIKFLARDALKIFGKASELFGR